MRRATQLVVSVIVLAVVVTALVARHFVLDDERALTEQFAQDRLDIVDEAALEIAGDLERVDGDLRLAARLARTAATEPERARELGALAAVVPAYRAVFIVSAANQIAQAVIAPDSSAALGERFATAVAETCALASSRGAGTIVLSPPLQGDETGWFRIAAYALVPGKADEAPDIASIAFLLDTRPFFEKLRLVAAEGQTHLLVLGSHGRPAPLTSAPLQAVMGDGAAAASPELAQLIEQIHAGERGFAILSAELSRRLGLGDGGLIAAHAPLPTALGGAFKIATFSGTSALRGHQRRIITRAALAVTLIAFFIFVLGWYVARTSRRRLVLEQKLAVADELAHLHEKADKILDHIPTGVIAIAEDNSISGVNRVLRERLAKDPAASRLEVIFGDREAALLAKLEELIKAARGSGTVQSLLAQRAYLFGVEAQLNLHVIPIATPLRDTSALLVIEDLTQLRSLESQLIRSEKLATIGVLAAGIAHEIGTPLGVVRGRAEFILGKLESSSPHARGLEVIVEQIDQVSRTIRQLLDFSRVKPSLGGTIDATAVARAATELLQIEASKSRVAVTVNTPRLPLLRGDADQLQQVLVNLVVNAIDACVPGGTVTLDARTTTDSALAEREVVEFSVVDDGCGIPTEHRNRVFDPFFTTKKRGKGTGLGLSIVAQIVSAHGGAISVEPAKDRGTRVVVTWPVAVDSRS